MVNFNRHEAQRLEGLIPAMRQGLDPAMAYDIFAGVESGALNRMAENRAMRQQAFSGAASQLREAAAGGTTQAGAMDLVNSYQAEMPGLGKGRYQGRLEDLVRGGLYQGPGQMSSLYQPEPTEAAGPTELTGEDVAALQTSAQEAARRQTATRAMAPGAAPMALGGIPMDEVTPGPTSLHDLRMQQMRIARENGYNDATLAKIYELLGTVFQEAGGDPGMAPLSYGG